MRRIDDRSAARRTRRQVLAGGVAGAAGLALGLPATRPAKAQTQAAAQTPVAARPLADGELEVAAGIQVVTAGGVNSIAAADAGGLLLVDGGSAATAGRVAEAAAALAPGTPIHTLFNTHWHPEQTGLNERLGRAGATIIAQENTRLWLTTDITYPWDGSHFEPLPPIAQPNRSFYEADELDSGVRAGYLRHAAHTDGDLYVYFPEADVLAVGDAASGAGWPFVDWWTGGWIGGIVGTLEYLLALAGPDTRIVPARGRILSRADLEMQFEMYNTIYERLSRLLNSGRGPDEAVEARPTAEFDAVMGPPDDFVRLAFQSLWAYLSPDA